MAKRKVTNRTNRKSTAMAFKSPPQTTVLRRLIDFDTAVSLHLYTFFHPILPHTLLKSLELSGDGRLFFPIILSVLLATTPIASLTTTTVSASSILFLNLLLGALFDLILIGALKYLIKRPRPVYNKNMFLSFSVDHWSFPSGHSSRVSFIASLFYLYSYQVSEVLNLLMNVGDGWKSVLVEHFVVIVAAWAGTTSISRVLLGRHFVMDVIAGMCLGVFEALVVFQVLNYEKLSSYVR